MAEERVIIYNQGVVVVELELFHSILEKLPKKTLIDIFACDIETTKRYMKYSKEDIINAIYVEYAE